MNFLTELREGLNISWSAIRANKLRSVLTTLGIVIGVLTVTLMGTAIDGLNNSFLNSISSIGADVFYVDRYNWFIQSRQEWVAQMKNPTIKINEVDALQNQMTLADAIAPVARMQEPVQYEKSGSTGVQVIGSTEQFQFTSGLTVADGRFFTATECDGGRPVCVIGSELATNLFHGESPLGETILIDRHKFQVVGVLEKLGGFAGNNLDSGTIVPLAQFTYLFAERPDYEIQVKVKSLALMDDAKEELRAALRRFRHVAPGEPDNFAINQQDQFLQLFHRVAGTIALVGLFITGLALFVGGIGIMNIMFVPPPPPPPPLPARKAPGAKKRTI